MPAPPPADRSLSRAQVDHVATLASLSLTDEEATSMTRELAAILRYVDQLDSLDTSSVLPTRGGGSAVPGWREDTEGPGLSHEDALAAAPRTAGGGFAVPAFVDANASGPAGSHTPREPGRP
jgi:aspartyl-tRNA(Asn)/glutamyl-tRNA(Gln) amidotransferase subunit C